MAKAKKSSSSTKQSIAQYDIAIIGGGLAGLTLLSSLLSSKLLAKQLSKQNNKLKIAIVETSDFIHSNHKPNAQHSSFDGKAIAVSYGSALKLDEWQVWPELKKVCQAIHKIEVSEKASAGYSFLDTPKAQSALGFVVEAQQFGQALANSVETLSDCNLACDVTWFCPEQLVDVIPSTSIDGCDSEQSYSQLTLKSGKMLNAKLIFACDGVNSQVKKILTPDFTEQDYTQFALTTNVEVDQAHNNIAYERFTETGPLAMLPMQGRKFGLVWCGNKAQTEHRLALTESEFLQSLQAEFGYRSGKLVKSGCRSIYPLKRSWLEQNYLPGVVFLANASHTVHPIAGQGFNLGIRDIDYACKTVEKAVLNHQNIASYSVWSDYLNTRQADIQLVLSATDSLVNLFSNNQAILKLGRNVGLAAIESLPKLKSQFASFAMGLSRLK